MLNAATHSGTLNKGHSVARARDDGTSPAWGLQSLLDYCIDAIAPCPWTAHAGGRRSRAARTTPMPIYTEAEKHRRDASPWTRVQAALAPAQFAVFLVSVSLVLHYLATGESLALATASIVLKTLVLYAIMITGSIWEKDVFGRWLFARPFFWEDVVSMLVLALHTAYLGAVLFGWGTPRDQMILALVAYASYVINAGQFLFKFYLAKQQSPNAAAAAGRAQ